MTGMTPTKRPVLITGATGAVGPLVVWKLHNAGYPVCALSRHVPKPGLLPAGVEVLAADIEDHGAVQSAMQGVEVAIHLAALLHIVNPTLDLLEKYEQVNVRGTINVVEAALQAGVRRIVFFGTAAVYDDSTHQILTEDDEPRPNTFYARTKRQAEDIVLGAKNSNGQPLGTVLRLCAIYGPRMTGRYKDLLAALARGYFVPIGDGLNRRTLIYEKDAANAAILAAYHPQAAGKIFNVSDGAFHSMNEILAVMCKALGRTPPRISLPPGPVCCLAGILEDAARLIGKTIPIGRHTVEKYLKDVAVDSSRIRNELGFRPEYDLLRGWKETVIEMQRSGRLS